MSYAQASLILDAFDEGIIGGIIETLKHQNPNISKEALYHEICDIMWSWDKEKIDYWCKWYGLIL